MFALDGRVNICKDCTIDKSVDEKTGEINELELNKILRQIDKPYYKDSLQSAYNQFEKEHSYVAKEDVKKYGKDVLKLYFKNIAMRQDRGKSYCDSENDGFMHTNSNTVKKDRELIENTYADITPTKKEDVSQEKITRDLDGFEVTDDMMNMFGDGYTPTEYRNMYKKYTEMNQTYTIKTSLHKEALLTYVRFKVKEEMATANGEVADAQKWYQAAQDAAEKAKLTPRQLSKEDLQGGLTNFSDIFTAVEECNERIPIMPEFKAQPKDSPDFVIWCYVNYERNLNNLPEVKYSDIYRFYDEKKKEYIDNYGDPYGIFTQDNSEINRDTIKKFITIPPEFRDGGNDG